MKRNFKFRINGNQGMFTCNDNEHPSIYINGGSSENKIALQQEFLVGVGTIIYMRELFGFRDDVKMEFHVVAIDDNEDEIVVETSTGSNTIDSVDTIIVDATETTAIAVDVNVDVDVDVNVDVNAEVFEGSIFSPKSLIGNTLVDTPINSTPIQIGSVTFSLPIEQHHYSAGLFSTEAKPSNRLALDPPDSTAKKLIIKKDPTGKSPKFRLQSPPPVRSPPPVNKDEESWLQEPRMKRSTKQMDSTAKKCKKE